jgi:hypothetical protein
MIDNKYEEDRIGQGKTAKFIGGTANVMSGLNGGWGIGGPNREQRSELNLGQKQRAVDLGQNAPQMPNTQKLKPASGNKNDK